MKASEMPLSNYMGKNWKSSMDHLSITLQPVEIIEKSPNIPGLPAIKRKMPYPLTKPPFSQKNGSNALEKLPTSETLLIEIIKARTVLGFLQFRVSNMADAKECVDPIADMYLRHNLKTEQGQAWVIMGSYKYMVEEELVELSTRSGKSHRNNGGNRGRHHLRLCPVYAGTCVGL